MSRRQSNSVPFPVSKSNSAINLPSSHSMPKSTISSSRSTATQSKMYHHSSNHDDHPIYAKPVRQTIPISKISTTDGPTTDQLPKQFVAAMRTLFDIMDDKRSGYVRLTDIEQRWKDDGAKGLPHGVIDSLRKVTPSNGLLSFERFCAGLKICLLRNQSEASSGAVLENSGHRSTKPLPRPKDAVIKPLRSQTGQISHPEKSGLSAKVKVTQHWNNHGGQNTAAVRPNNIFPVVQRALSLPKLCPDSDDQDRLSPSHMPIVLPPLYAPPKPPRTALVLGNGVTNINHLDRLDKAEIRTALQNWQMGVMMNEDKRATLNRGSGDGGSVDSAMAILPAPAKKGSNSRRREPRRHTLQNGIDYNMLKRLKQFEQEKDILLQGLSAVDKTREWYIRQITDVQDKIKQLGKMGTHMDQWSDAHEERLDLQKARVTEVNRHLTALTTGNYEDRNGGFPLHMNLAVRQTSSGRHPLSTSKSMAFAHHHHHHHQQPVLPAKPPKSLPPPPVPTTTTAHFPSNEQLVASNRLKQQNRQLSDEVTLKNQRIAALERERQNLMRELVASQRTTASAIMGAPHHHHQQQNSNHHNTNLSIASDEVIF